MVSAGVMIGGSIAVVVVITVIIVSIIFFTTHAFKKIDSTCTPKEDEKDVNGATFTIQLNDEDKKACLPSSCNSGYNLTNKKCVLAPTFTEGDTCTPSTTDEIDNGVYTYNSVGKCFATSCTDGYTLTDNQCVLDRKFINMEYFRGGRTSNLNESNSFVMFVNDFSNYDTKVKTLSDGTEVNISNVFDETYVVFYEDHDGSITKLIHPSSAQHPALYTVGTILNQTGGYLRFNHYILEDAGIEENDDIYYIKTPNVQAEYELTDGTKVPIYGNPDDANRQSDKYIVLNADGDGYTYTDKQADADLFRLETRSSEMTLPAPFDDLTDTTVVDSGLTTKNYLVRVVEDTEGDE